MIWMRRRRRRRRRPRPRRRTWRQRWQKTLQRRQQRRQQRRDCACCGVACGAGANAGTGACAGACTRAAVVLACSGCVLRHAAGARWKGATTQQCPSWGGWAWRPAAPRGGARRTAAPRQRTYPSCLCRAPSAARAAVLLLLLQRPREEMVAVAVIVGVLVARNSKLWRCCARSASEHGQLPHHSTAAEPAATPAAQLLFHHRP